jgi:transposase-like protein
MTKPVARDPIYRRRRFQPEIIELCVRWYLTYRLSYRDLVEMVAERYRIPHDHSALGTAVRARVRETLGSLCSTRAFVLADGRDGGSGTVWRSLSLPGRR